MQGFIKLSIRLTAMLMLGAALSACGTISTLGKLEPGAGAEASKMWDRWVDSGGDIAVATTWERKVKPGVTQAQIEQSLASVSAEYNMRSVGELTLSKELEARTGKPEKLLKVYSYCNPETARKMVSFSPHMSAYLPCRVTLLEKEDGLWIYTLNMDMMVNMGRKLPPELMSEVVKIRNGIWQMIEKGASGDF